MTLTNAYDQVPYIRTSFPETHPRRLQTVAAMHGLTSPPIEKCRVLELGCAGGWNLLPMAAQLPHATLLGIDLSARQIEEGRAALAAAGLNNIELRQMSILDVTEQFGTFDYIIAHGVYSWVPRDVREKVLSIFRHNLAANGVAYVSYNLYPGWYSQQWLRDAMCYLAPGPTARWISPPAGRSPSSWRSRR